MENNENMLNDRPDMEPVEMNEPTGSERKEVELANPTEASDEQPREGETGEECAEPVGGADWTAKVKGWLMDVLKFLLKYRKWVVLAAVAATVVVLAVVIGKSVSGDKNRYESLGQTITEMKRISEFCTANYIGEVMIQDEEMGFLRKKNIVLIVRGKVRAGFDLTKMEAVVENDSTISLSLPRAQILDIITNPSDIRTFSEKGTWSHDRTTITKNAARAKLLELVMEDNLLGTAEANGRMQMTSIFMAFGFKHVNIEFVADSTACDPRAVVGDSVSGNATTLFSK